MLSKKLSDIQFQIDKWEEQVYILNRELKSKIYSESEINGFKADLISIEQRLEKLYNEKSEVANENNV